ncbi:MAG: response regulator [Spartobacteria bacterium]|nr:response regulator [Spartobacteria bacterium]
MADQSQLEQVILNLVINACDAMWYEGTLQLGTTHYRYESNDSDIFYDELPEEGIDYACISLQDTGCGISAENLSRIFEPFFSTKPTDKGTGLGLFQVYTTIRQHKGVISVQSIPEEGSAFHLFLPCAEKTVSVDKAISNIPVPVGCETILLIEDDPIVRRTTRRVLSHLGYTVIEVAHPHAAGKLTHAQMQHVDLLLVDAMLPYIDGITFARTCVGTYPHMKVLIISGFPEDQLASIGMIPCEFPLLTKPYFRETLATRIRHLLDAE